MKTKIQKEADEMVTFRIPKSLKARLIKVAQEDHRSLGAFVRMVLEEKINQIRSPERKAA